MLASIWSPTTPRSGPWGSPSPIPRTPRRRGGCARSSHSPARRACPVIRARDLADYDRALGSQPPRAFGDARGALSAAARIVHHADVLTPQRSQLPAPQPRHRQPPPASKPRIGQTEITHRWPHFRPPQRTHILAVSTAWMAFAVRLASQGPERSLRRDGPGSMA
jgi:hypothetical protein